MKKYRGTKEVSAEPMGHNEFLNEIVDPKRTEPGRKGYKVIYENGHVSWSPKDVFEEFYRPSDTHKDRLLIEAQDAAVKINNLNSFMATKEFTHIDRTEKDLLYEQQRVMSSYLQILGKRLENANGKFKHI